MPSVSIVLLTRNRPRLLLDALRCVAAQTHPELELVLVRDGGEPLSDEARARIEALDFPAMVLEHDGERHGVARSRNHGVAHARADACALLDDDDAWAPDHVARLASTLKADDAIDVAYSDARIRREEGGERVIARDFDVEIFLRDDYLPPSTMLIRRAAFERFGAFDESLAYSEDWDWLIGLVKRGGRVVRSPGATATILVHAGAATALHLDRLEERKRSLDVLSRRHGLPPIRPKTFWEVAETVCPGSVATS